jgi:hypothetical protein
LIPFSLAFVFFIIHSNTDPTTSQSTKAIFFLSGRFTFSHQVDLISHPQYHLLNRIPLPFSLSSPPITTTSTTTSSTTTSTTTTGTGAAASASDISTQHPKIPNAVAIVSQLPARALDLNSDVSDLPPPGARAPDISAVLAREISSSTGEGEKEIFSNDPLQTVSVSHRDDDPAAAKSDDAVLTTPVKHDLAVSGSVTRSSLKPKSPDINAVSAGNMSNLSRNVSAAVTVTVRAFYF